MGMGGSLVKFLGNIPDELPIPHCPNPQGAAASNSIVESVDLHQVDRGKYAKTTTSKHAPSQLPPSYINVCDIHA